jgi:hypothetical protein
VSYTITACENVALEVDFSVSVARLFQVLSPAHSAAADAAVGLEEGAGHEAA